jgi:hypothetical protein
MHADNDELSRLCEVGGGGRRCWTATRRFTDGANSIGIMNCDLVLVQMLTFVASFIPASLPLVKILPKVSRAPGFLGELPRNFMAEPWQYQGAQTLKGGKAKSGLDDSETCLEA